MKTNRFLISFIVLLFLGSLLLFLGRYLVLEKSFFLVETLFSPDHIIEENGRDVVKRLITALAIFHAALGIFGFVLIAAQQLFSLPQFPNQSNKPSSLNLWVVSTITALYLVGFFVISKEVSGVRLSIYQEDSLFEYLTVASYLAAGMLFIAIVLNIIGSSIPDKKRFYVSFFIILTLICIFIAGEEISWGQRLFGWETPAGIASWNNQQETNIHNYLSPLRKEQLVMVSATVLNIIIFGIWLTNWNSTDKTISFFIPHPAMFVLLIFIGVSSGYDEELTEELVAAFMLIYSIWIWGIWKFKDYTNETSSEISPAPERQSL